MAKYSGALALITSPAQNESLGFMEQGATTRRFNVHEVQIGSDATPADASGKFRLYRATGGTPAGTAVTEFAWDGADVAATVAMLNDLTTEPTGKVSGPSWPQNQRATFRWVTLENTGIWCPATADNGVGVEAISSTVYASEGFAAWTE